MVPIVPVPACITTHDLNAIIPLGNPVSEDLVALAFLLRLDTEVGPGSGRGVISRC